MSGLADLMDLQRENLAAARKAVVDAADALPADLRADLGKALRALAFETESLADVHEMMGHDAAAGRALGRSVTVNEIARVFGGW